MSKCFVMKMTPAEIREEKARVLMRDKKRLEQYAMQCKKHQSWLHNVGIIYVGRESLTVKEIR